MTFDYFFILSCFKNEKSLRISTLYHLLKGKKTSSVLSYGYFYDTISYFGLFPKLTEQKYKNCIAVFIKNKWLIEKNGYAILTELGRQTLAEQEFPNLNDLNQLSFYKWDFIFFDFLLFASQIISEMAHSNSNYIPIENDFYKQTQLKKWLKTQNNSLAKSFYDEWYDLVANLKASEKEMILGQLVGYQIRGLTLNQIADKQGKDYVYVYLSFKNSWHRLLTLILNDKSKFNLFNELIQFALKEQREESYQLSIKLYQQGLSIKDISKIRSLKQGTITDHLIEGYMTTRDKKYMPNFSEEMKNKLLEWKEKTPHFYQWDYQEALTVCPNITFYEFRCFQFYLKEMEVQND